MRNKKKAVIDYEGIEIRLEFHEEKCEYECGGFPITNWETIYDDMEIEGIEKRPSMDAMIQDMIDKYKLEDSVEWVYSTIEDKLAYLLS